MIQQDGNVRVVDDGFLYDRTADNILQLLCHDTYHCPELTGSLVEILDVFCHHRTCNGFPCLFDDQHLTVLLDSHLLDEYVHNDECHQREEYLAVLDVIYLEDDEGLIKEG